MRWRWILWSVGLLVVVGLLGFAWNSLPRVWVEGLLADQTGTRVSVGEVRISGWGPRVWARDIVLYNPPEFGSAPALRIRELQAVLSWGDLLRGRSRLRRLQVEIASVAVVQGQSGRLNWQVIGEETRRRHSCSGFSEQVEAVDERRLKTSLPGVPMAQQERCEVVEGHSQNAESVDEPPSSGPQVDELVVKLDRIEVYRMEERASEPVPRQLDVQLVHAATNVTDVNEFAWEFGAALAVRALPLLAVQAVSDAEDQWSESLDRLLKKADRWWKKAGGDEAVSDLLQNLPAVLPGVFR